MPHCSSRLYSESFGCSSPLAAERPVLVFLHGLLGCGRDWQRVIAEMATHWPCLCIDLPGHGHSKWCRADGFDDVCRQLSATLRARGIRRYVLVGYSLGARIAMYYASCYLPAETYSEVGGEAGGEVDNEFGPPRLAGLVVEGGNFGLPEIEREPRWKNDLCWSRRFATESLDSVLADWYRQPVFLSLNDDQRQGFIAKRSDNLGVAIAHMLQATSLAKQPFLLPLLTGLTMPVHYICGENDTKFKTLASQSALDHSVIGGAGHNVHAEQPDAFAGTLRQILINKME